MGRKRSTRPVGRLPSFSSIETFVTGTGADLTYGRPATLKVFISSVMRNGSLAAERNAVAAVVDDHPDAEGMAWERNANAGPYSSVGVCTGHASTADVLFLVVSDDLTDVTEAEWRAAQKGGAACAMFTKTGVSRSSRLQTFIKIERSNGIDVPFEGLPSLQQAMSDALRRCITDASRQRTQRRRVGALPAGHPAHLLEAGVERAVQHYFSGSASDAAEVLEEIDALLGPGVQRPEALELVTGLVHGAAGRTSAAVAAYKRVILSPASTEPAIAVAHQNMGIEALKLGDLPRARELMQLALDIYRKIDDWFGVLQMVLNLATLSLAEGDLTRATRLSDFGEELVGCFREPLAHQRS
ncbi:MAG: tetratricopeptide repeat protein [Actinomycetota bacterium]|nr:tetratricopeptide repeat protein [Actinomycetota bacterium]